MDDLNDTGTPEQLKMCQIKQNYYKYQKVGSPSHLHSIQRNIQKAHYKIPASTVIGKCMPGDGMFWMKHKRNFTFNLREFVLRGFPVRKTSLSRGCASKRGPQHCLLVD